MAILEFDFSPKEEEKPRKGYVPPKTSILAHDSVKEHKGAIYEKIIQALEEMKVGGTSEQIANHLGVKHEKVWKRLSEMEAAGTIFRVGTTRPTSTGRQSMVRQLTSFKTQKGNEEN